MTAKIAEFSSLNERKLIRRACLIIFIYMLMLVHGFLLGAWLIDRDWHIIANDFSNVYTAGKLALEGRAADAYDGVIQKAEEVKILGHDFGGYIEWLYPPYFFGVAALLACVPYLGAFFLWGGVSLWMFACAMRRVIGHRFGAYMAPAFPASLWNFSVAQNGFLTGGLLGASLYHLEKRPRLAGLFLGLLSYKPQFGLLFPLILLIEKRWQTFWIATLTVVALAVASLLILGVEPWHQFFTMTGSANSIVYHGDVMQIGKKQSLLALLRELGWGMQAAWIAQGGLVVFVLAICVRMRRRAVPEELKAAVLGWAALMVTPYIYMYDLVALLVPLGFVWRLALRDGWLPYERGCICLVWVLLFAYPLVIFQMGFLAMLVVGAMIVRRERFYLRSVGTVG